jgi:nucleoside-diphosphate-sugar epimerase
MARALVAGALGVIGRSVVAELERRGWETVGIGRRTGTDTARTRYLPVDLLVRPIAGRSSPAAAT